MDEPEMRRALKIALLSPLRGLEIVIKKQCPQASYYYPLMCFSFLRVPLRR